MRRRDDPLFANKELSAVLSASIDSIEETVERMGEDQFLVSPVEDLVQHFVAKLWVDPLVIYEDRMEMEQSETRLDMSRDIRYGGRATEVPGVEVRVSIPFSGAPTLWEFRPSRFTTIFPFAQMVRAPKDDRPGEMVYVTSMTHDSDEGALKANLERNMDFIRQYLSWQKLDIDKFNNSLAVKVRDAVRRRRERLEKYRGISDALGIPLRRRNGTPSLEPIRVERKVTKLLPPPPKDGYKPEPGIDDKTYKDILVLIRHMGRTMEATPKTYNCHGEEDLRDMILAHLNGYFEGGASGESFRAKGKTDILIEEKDRQAFIGECKVWTGAKQVANAVDQLLSYHTWRDCKSALIIFNKDRAGFTDLLAKLQQALDTHPLKVASQSCQGSGEWCYIFRTKEDEGRRVRVQVFLFNLYVVQGGE